MLNLEFYGDISWELRCNDEIKVWAHFCPFLTPGEIDFCKYCIFSDKTIMLHFLKMRILLNNTTFLEHKIIRIMDIIIIEGS